MMLMMSSLTINIYIYYYTGWVSELHANFDPLDKALSNRVLSSNFKLKSVV